MGAHIQGGFCILYIKSLQGIPRCICQCFGVTTDCQEARDLERPAHPTVIRTEATLCGCRCSGNRSGANNYWVPSTWQALWCMFYSCHLKSVSQQLQEEDFIVFMTKVRKWRLIKTVELRFNHKIFGWPNSHAFSKYVTQPLECSANNTFVRIQCSLPMAIEDGTIVLTLLLFSGISGTKKQSQPGDSSSSTPRGSIGSHSLYFSAVSVPV